MNKTLAISVIVLVAVVMGMSSIVPVLAHDVRVAQGLPGSGVCPADFSPGRTSPGTHPDHNVNSIVCTNGQVVVDDLPCAAVRGAICR